MFGATARLLVAAMPPTVCRMVLFALDEAAVTAPCPAERGIAQALARAIRNARD